MTIALGLIGVWGASSARHCQAQISFLTMNRNNTYLQTGDSAVNYNGSWFASSLNSTNPTDFNSVMMIYPGPGSPVAVPTLSPGAFLYESPTVPTQAAKDSAFPAGSYVFDASGNMGPATASFVFSIDAYSLTTPSLTGTTFSSRQGMNPLQPFTVQLSPFVPDPIATQTYIYILLDLRRRHRPRHLQRWVPSRFDHQPDHSRRHLVAQRELRLRADFFGPRHRAKPRCNLQRGPPF